MFFKNVNFFTHAIFLPLFSRRTKKEEGFIPLRPLSLPPSLQAQYKSSLSHPRDKKDARSRDEFSKEKSRILLSSVGYLFGKSRDAGDLFQKTPQLIRTPVTTVHTATHLTDFAKMLPTLRLALPEEQCGEKTKLKIPAIAATYGLTQNDFPDPVWRT